MSQAYRDSFASLCEGTVERILDDLPTGRLFDVGSGTGALAAKAAQRGFEVTAVDADADMVAMTNSVLPGSCSQHALPDLGLPDAAFPAVVANFVVNHLPDPRAGVRELARVMAPGGRLAMTIWPAAGAGWAPMVSEVFSRAGASKIPSRHLPDSLDFPRTPAGLARLATDAGLIVETATTLTWRWDVRPESLWAGISCGVATPGARYLAQSPSTQQEIREVFDEVAQDAATSGVLSFECSAAYVLAAA